MEAIQAVIDEEVLFASTRYDEEQKIVFSPPAYEQRYRRVANLLGKFSIHMKHIVEFGVAEMKSFMLFRNTLNKLKIFDLVDIDGELLYVYLQGSSQSSRGRFSRQERRRVDRESLARKCCRVQSKLCRC